MDASPPPRIGCRRFVHIHVTTESSEKPVVVWKLLVALLTSVSIRFCVLADNADPQFNVLADASLEEENGRANANKKNERDHTVRDYVPCIVL